MKRDWTATSPWCEHSTQSWEQRESGTWCSDCENYVDGWRREIRRPSSWFFVALWLASLAAGWFSR